jgi:hypothetical protein
MTDDGAQCERCLEFQDEVRQLRQRLAASDRYVTYSVGPDLELELQRWLAVNPRSTAAAGFRAGWARMARLISPRLRDWEARWWRALRDNELSSTAGRRAEGNSPSPGPGLSRSLPGDFARPGSPPFSAYAKHRGPAA